MVKVTCDMCGCNIDYDAKDTDSIECEHGIITFDERHENMEFHICTDCSNKIFNFITSYKLRMNNELNDKLFDLLNNQNKEVLEND